MPNPIIKLEVEIAPVGVWFTEIDYFGNRTDRSLYLTGHYLEQDINWLTKELQGYFNF